MTHQRLASGDLPGPDEPVRPLGQEAPAWRLLSRECAAVSATRHPRHDHVAATAALTVRANVTVTDVPFGNGEIHAHLHTGPGAMRVEPGHLAGADLAITLDYDTATAILAAPQTAVRAFMLGKVKVSFGATVAELGGSKDVESPARARSISNRRIADHVTNLRSISV